MNTVIKIAAKQLVKDLTKKLSEGDRTEAEVKELIKDSIIDAYYVWGREQEKDVFYSELEKIIAKLNSSHPGLYDYLKKLDLENELLEVLKQIHQQRRDFSESCLSKTKYTLG